MSVYLTAVGAPVCVTAIGEVVIGSVAVDDCNGRVSLRHSAFASLSTAEAAVQPTMTFSRVKTLLTLNLLFNTLGS